MVDYNNKKARYISSLVNLFGGILFFWIKNKEIDQSFIKKILIIKLDRIGDTFLSTPTIEALRKKFPSADIKILVAPWNKSVLDNNPNINEIKVFSEAIDVHSNSFLSLFNYLKTKKLSIEIQEICPDLSIDLEGHPMNVLAMFRAGVPIRIGFKDKIFSFLLTNKVRNNGLVHQSDIYFSIARLLGFDGQKPVEMIFVNDEDKNLVNRFKIENNLDDFIVVHLSAGRSYRLWPLDHFVSLGRLLILLDKRLKLVLIGGGEDKYLAKEFINKLNCGDRVVDATKVLGIPSTYELMPSAKLFIGSESAPMHFAGARGIATIAFMNVWSGIDRWKPLGDKVYVFRSKNVHKCPGVSCHLIPCPNMAAISVNEVYHFINEKHLL